MRNKAVGERWVNRSHGNRRMYSEKQMMDRRVFWMIVAIEVPIMLMLVALVATSHPDWWVMLIVLGAGALAPAMMWWGHVRVRLDDTHLRWAFVPFWRGGVALDDIEHIEVVQVCAMRQFGGWGIRGSFGKPARLGLIAKSGGAVEITRRSKKTNLVITSDDPDRLADEILRRVLREEGVAMPETGA